MTADPLAVALARTREQLRRAEDEIAVLRADNARLRARQTTDVVLPEQRSEEPQATEAVAVPRRAFDWLVQVAGHVSFGKSYAFEGPYPDAAARFALGALDDAGLLPEYDEANDHSHRDRVNAPLRPETIQVLGKRLASGDYPVHYVTPVMTPEQQARFDADHADGPTPGCDCGHDGMGRAWHAGDCEWRAAKRITGPGG